MFYHIDNLCPRTDIPMSCCGFNIKLWPAFKAAVKQRSLGQEQVNTAIKNLHRVWLDGCGYDQIFDPEADPLNVWKAERSLEKLKPSASAHPLYDDRAIRVTWGEWGPEHITVPGNACGLDIDTSIGAPSDGRILVPHNVDSIQQAHLLLVVFTWFAGDLILNLENT